MLHDELFAANTVAECSDHVDAIWKAAAINLCPVLIPAADEDTATKAIEDFKVKGLAGEHHLYFR